MPAENTLHMDRWNLPLILRETGGPVDLHAKLVARGHDIQLQSVRAWFRRGKIPANWIAAIIAVTGRDPRNWIEAPKPGVRQEDDIW
jgi:hypothetical protein